MGTMYTKPLQIKDPTNGPPIVLPVKQETYFLHFCTVILANWLSYRDLLRFRISNARRTYRVSIGMHRKKKFLYGNAFVHFLHLSKRNTALEIQ